MTNKITIASVFLTLLILITVMLDLKWGAVDFSFQEVLSILSGGEGNARTDTYIIEARLYRVFVAVIAGAGLSVSGLLLQSLFRNPLAGPSVLGISSGSSFGVALLIFIFPGLLVTSGWASMTVTFLFAIAGAMAVMFIILFVGIRLKSNTAMLIAGLMLSYVLGAGVQIMLQYAGAENTRGYVVWGLGSFSNVPLPQIIIVGIIVVCLAVLVLFFSKPMNGMLLGERYAKSIGVKVKQMQYVIILVTSILTGLITAICGPIAFVGIAVPHIVKMFVKSADHKVLIPLTIVVGVWICVLSDLLSSYPVTLPVNAVTSLLGAPVIIWIVVKQYRHSGW